MKRVFLRCVTFLVCVLIASFGSPWETTAGEIHIGWVSDSKGTPGPKKAQKSGPPAHAPPMDIGRNTPTGIILPAVFIMILAERCIFTSKEMIGGHLYPCLST